MFLFPSSTETFGNVVLEAMACGAPVIRADTGGVTDTVRHEWNGMRCEPGNVDAFAAALERLYRDESLSGRMMARGLAHSLRQSWDASPFDELLAKFREVSATDDRSSFRHIRG